MSVARYLSKLGALLNSSGQVGASGLQSTLDLSGKTLTLPAINKAGVLQVSGITTDASGTANNSIAYGNSVTLTTVSASSRILLWVFCSSTRPSTSGSDQVGARITHAGGTILDANITSVRDDPNWNSMDGMTLVSHGVAAGTVLTITPRFQAAGSITNSYSGLRLVAMEVI